MVKVHEIKKLSFGTDKKIVIFIFSIGIPGQDRDKTGLEFSVGTGTDFEQNPCRSGFVQP